MSPKLHHLDAVLLFQRLFWVIVVLLLALMVTGCGEIVCSEAEADLTARLPVSELCVYPAVVHAGDDFSSDIEHVAALTEALAGAGFSSVVTVTDGYPDIRTSWRANEAVMLERSAKKVCDHVLNHPPDAEYVLYAEYLVGRDRRQVGAVHWVIADAEGRVAAAGLLNTHHRLFKEIDPVGVEGCQKLLVEHVKERLAELRPAA